MPRNKQQKSAAKRLLKKPIGKLLPIDLTGLNAPTWMTRAFRNNRYVVMIDDAASMTGGITAIKAMVQRHDDRPIPNHWREMQAIKNELFGKATTGIEYYPAESNLVNLHNIYWLWILPLDALPIADQNHGA